MPCPLALRGHTIAATDTSDLLAAPLGSTSRLAVNFMPSSPPHRHQPRPSHAHLWPGSLWQPPPVSPVLCQPPWGSSTTGQTANFLNPTWTGEQGWWRGGGEAGAGLQSAQVCWGEPGPAEARGRTAQLPPTCPQVPPHAMCSRGQLPITPHIPERCALPLPGVQVRTLKLAKGK